MADSYKRAAYGIQKLKDNLKAAPASIATAVASQAAPVITTFADAAYDSGRTVYGDARKLSVDGRTLKLYRKGKARADLRFVSIGTDMRCYFKQPYVKYLIGKYTILPSGNQAMPMAWRENLDTITQQVKVVL